MQTDWSNYSITYDGITYDLQYRDKANLIACEDYTPSSPSPDYPSPITNTGDLVTEDDSDWNTPIVYGENQWIGQKPSEVLGACYRFTLSVRGKNLFDKNKATHGCVLSETDGSISENLAFSVSEYIKVSPNTAYRASGFGTSKSVFCLFDTSKNFIQSSISYTGQRNISTTTDTAYLRFSFSTSAIETTQMEVGSVVTEYEPYNPLQSFNSYLNAPLRGLQDGTKDEYSPTHGQITRRMGKKVLDGTEVWTKYAVNTRSNVYSSTFIGCALEYQSSICTHFKNANRSWADGPGSYGTYSDHDSHVNRKYFHVGAFFPTSDDFKAYLAAQHAAGTPVTIYYKLAEPIIETAVPISLPTYPGTTIIEMKSTVQPSIMEAEYWAAEE